MKTDVSIIICTHQRGSKIADTLESLRGVCVPDVLAVELLVVENGAKVDTEIKVRQFHHPKISVCYLHEQKQGKSRALNRAIAEAKGEILVFTDDDLRFDASWLVEICQPIWDGKGVAVAGKVVLASHLVRNWMTRYHFGWLAGINYKDSENPEEIAGANMAIHRQVLDKVSRFDTELGGGGLGNCEDTLYSRQLIQAGFKIANAPQALVEHHFVPVKLQYGQWVKAARAAGRSRAYLLYHWWHQDLRHPRLQYYYFLFKLRIRKAISPRLQTNAEGIPAWELSYRFDLAKCSQFMIERRRPRNYNKMGLTKINGEY